MTFPQPQKITAELVSQLKSVQLKPMLFSMSDIDIANVIVRYV